MSALIPALIQLAIGRLGRGGGGGYGGGGRSSGSGGYGGRASRGGGGEPKQQFSTAEKNAYRDLLQFDKPPDFSRMINDLDEEIAKIRGMVGRPEAGADVDVGRFMQE